MWVMLPIQARLFKCMMLPSLAPWYSFPWMTMLPTHSRRLARKQNEIAELTQIYKLLSLSYARTLAKHLDKIIFC